MPPWGQQQARAWADRAKTTIAAMRARADAFEAYATDKQRRPFQPWLARFSADLLGNTEARATLSPLACHLWVCVLALSRMEGVAREAAQQAAVPPRFHAATLHTALLAARRFANPGPFDALWLTAGRAASPLVALVHALELLLSVQADPRARDNFVTASLRDRDYTEPHALTLLSGHVMGRSAHWAEIFLYSIPGAELTRALSAALPSTVRTAVEATIRSEDARVQQLIAALPAGIAAAPPAASPLIQDMPDLATFDQRVRPVAVAVAEQIRARRGPSPGTVNAVDEASTPQRRDQVAAPATGSDRFRDSLCFNCGVVGHAARSCTATRCACGIDVRGGNQRAVREKHQHRHGCAVPGAASAATSRSSRGRPRPKTGSAPGRISTLNYPPATGQEQPHPDDIQYLDDDDTLNAISETPTETWGAYFERRTAEAEARGDHVAARDARRAWVAFDWARMDEPRPTDGDDAGRATVAALQEADDEDSDRGVGSVDAAPAALVRVGGSRGRTVALSPRSPRPGGRLFVDVVIAGIPTRAMLDSGAARSVLPESFRGPVRRGTVRPPLAGVDGTPLHVLGEVISRVGYPLTQGGQEDGYGAHRFAVVRGVKDAILGADVMAKDGLVLAFEGADGGADAPAAAAAASLERDEPPSGDRRLPPGLCVPESASVRQHAVGRPGPRPRGTLFRAKSQTLLRPGATASVYAACDDRYMDTDDAPAVPHTRAWGTTANGPLRVRRGWCRLRLQNDTPHSSTVQPGQILAVVLAAGDDNADVAAAVAPTPDAADVTAESLVVGGGGRVDARGTLPPLADAGALELDEQRAALPDEPPRADLPPAYDPPGSTYPTDADLREAASAAPPAWRQRLFSLLQRYRHAWSHGDKPAIGRAKRPVRLTLRTDARPKVLPTRRYSPVAQEFIRAQVHEFLRLGVAVPISSPWRSPIVVAPKPGGRGLRFAIDLRYVSSQVHVTQAPTGNVEESLQGLAGAKYFARLDLSSGFFNVPVCKEQVPLFSFDAGMGQTYALCRLPMGVSSSSALFALAVHEIYIDGAHKILEEAPWTRRAQAIGLDWAPGRRLSRLQVYQDDVAVGADSPEELLFLFELLLEATWRGRMKLKLAKAELFVTSCSFLGHVVSERGISQDPKKLEALRSLRPPESLQELKSSLAFFSYFRSFVANFSEHAHPLNAVLRAPPKTAAATGAAAAGAVTPGGTAEPRRAVFRWGPPQQRAFEYLRSAIINATARTPPRFDRRFIIDVDASGFALGCCCAQEYDGVEFPVAFYSRQLTDPERRWSATEREMLAICFGLQSCSHLVWGRADTLVGSDHGAASWLHSADYATSPRLARLALKAAEFTFYISQRPGRLHSNCDLISRQTVPTPTRSQGQLIVDGLLTAPAATAADAAAAPSGRASGAADNDRAAAAAAAAAPPRSVATIDPPPAPADLAPARLAPLQREDSDLSRHRQHLRQRRVDSVFVHKTSGAVYIPSSLRRPLLAHLHGAVHAGDRRLLVAAQRGGFFWLGMAHDAEETTRSCRSCTLRQPRGAAPADRRPAAAPSPVLSPGERFAVDHVKLDHGHLLVVVDVFSRYLWAKTASALDTQETTRILGRIFDRVGTPKSIIADNGAAFSAAFDKWLDARGCKRIRIAAGNSRANATVERTNRALREGLVARVDADPGSTWTDHLSGVVAAMRATPNRTTDATPFQLFFGRAHVGDAQRLTGYDDLPTRTRQARARIAEEAALARTTTAQAAQVADPASASAPQPFFVGDRVLLEDRRHAYSQSSRRKAEPRWRGPYEVQEVVGTDTIRTAPLHGYPHGIVTNRRFVRLYARADDTPGRGNGASTRESGAAGPARGGAGAGRPTDEPEASTRRGRRRRAHANAAATAHGDNEEYAVDFVYAEAADGTLRTAWKGYGPQGDLWQPPNSLPRGVVSAYRRGNAEFAASGRPDTLPERREFFRKRLRPRTVATLI